MLDIRDPAVVIIGEGGGIGLEIARCRAQNGDKVVIADVAPQFLEGAEKELKALGGDFVQS